MTSKCGLHYGLISDHSSKNSGPIKRRESFHKWAAKSLNEFIHSFCSLSYDRSVASSKAISPQGAI
jgi:hypothetical protein